MFSLSSERISRNSNWGPLLVWAKMRGYPYWPAVVARDPKNGEYATVTDTFLKPIKKFHVLFLEYGNQRAWVTSSSIKEYKGIDKFNSDKAGATKSQRADYTPGKRYVAPFNKAVDYAEELRGGPDEDRLEQVLLRYGWVMVGEADQEQRPSPATTGRQAAARTPAATSSAGKKRKQSGNVTSQPSTELDAEELVNRSTDSEADSQNSSLTLGASPPLESGKVRGGNSSSSSSMETATARPVAGGSGRRSSAEAESRIDPGLDDSEIEDLSPEMAGDVSITTAANLPSDKFVPAVGEAGSSSKSATKRQNSSRRSSVANGDKESNNSSEADDHHRPPPAKKKSTPATAVTKLAKSTTTNKSLPEKAAGSKAGATTEKIAAQSRTPKSDINKLARTATPALSPLSAASSPVTSGGTGGDKDEFPRVGDLVWGRMAGFPYWPSFVTRSPEGKDL